MERKPVTPALPSRSRAWTLGTAGALLSLLTLGVPSNAQDSEFLTIKLGNESIREIAKEYLGDPDLWTEVLRSSGLRSITELRPGIELKLPANAVSTANKALIDASGQIQTANQAGAQIFAHENITKAIALHDQALSRRVKADWTATRSLATESYGEATVALEKSNAARERAAEALVTDRHGNVEGQRPQDLGWRGLQLQSTLVEEERVRTLSDSTAQITFRDASRLRLNANSNAIIQRLRYDPLKRSEEAKVSLIEGDFYALLAGSNTRASFNVEVPRVNASIDSGNFWVRNDQDGAKFTNYDDGAVEVAAGGERVTLGRNEGTIVRGGAAPREKMTLLGAPSLSAPLDRGTAYNRAPRIGWNAVPDAVGYWIEIAADQSFTRMIVSRFGVEMSEFQPDQLEPGEYFWRVAALDSFGLPGERSTAWRFQILVDTSPPFLTIRAPERDAILRAPEVTIEGESEPGAALTVQGTRVLIEPNGRFSAKVTAKSGTNTIELIATDPAGNETRRERSFVYMPDEKSTVRFDEGIPSVGANHFLSSVETISLGGQTTANAQIRILDGKAAVASAATDAEGRFRLNMPIRPGTNQYLAVVTAQSGFSSEQPFSVTVDRAAPEIRLDAPPPRLTSTTTFTLGGRTKPGAKLLLNGREIANRNGSFEETIDLDPGVNMLTLSVSDAAGNITTDRWQVQLDREPPSLVGSRAAPAPGSRSALFIEVQAEDASGLAAVAPIKIEAGGRMVTGHLRFNRATRSYQGTIPIPAAALSEAKLREIELVDDAGNRRLFTVN